MFIGQPEDEQMEKWGVTMGRSNKVVREKVRHVDLRDPGKDTKIHFLVKQNVTHKKLRTTRTHQIVSACSHVCVYLFACLRVLVYMFACTCSHVCVCLFTCLRVLVHMFACTFSNVCVYLFKCLCVLVHMFACTCSHVCVYLFTCLRVLS
jgi:hypothetical protein